MFHTKQGLFFERADDHESGAVRIFKTPGKLPSECLPPDEKVETIILSACEWASVIAVVSAEGETSEKFQSALHFHNENAHMNPTIPEKSPRIGDIVNYVLCDSDTESPESRGKMRPAIIIRVWSEKCVNLQVFTDGDGTKNVNDGQPNVIWRTSINFDADHARGTWHFRKE